MRTTLRLHAAAALVGGGLLLLAGPATAQTAPACGYPFDCPPVAGGGGGPSTGETPPVETPEVPETPIGGGGGGPAEGPDVVDNSPVRGATGGAATATLPFTGGEVTLIAAAGLAALGGGAALVVAGRKRAQA